MDEAGKIDVKESFQKLYEKYQAGEDLTVDDLNIITSITTDTAALSRDTFIVGIEEVLMEKVEINNINVTFSVSDKDDDQAQMLIEYGNNFIAVDMDDDNNVDMFYNILSHYADTNEGTVDIYDRTFPYSTVKSDPRLTLAFAYALKKFDRRC